MNSTLYMILTDESARTIEAVEEQLSNELSAGSPWLTDAE